MKLNQKGSTAIVGLLAVILILAIGGVGYMVYTNQKNKNIDTNNSTSTSNESTTISNSNFLEIKEWGIKIQLRDYDKVNFAIKDAKGEGLAGPYDGYMDPSFKPEFLQNKSCDPGLGLYRSKTMFKVESADSQKQIGGYYYHVTGSPAACGENPGSNPDDQLKGRFAKDFDPRNIEAL